jgi:hypothetical protein
MYFPIPLPIHNAGEPETQLQRALREFAWNLHTLLNWRLPKAFGLDRCSECGARPCGTQLGRKWLCSAHSCFESNW